MLETKEAAAGESPDKSEVVIKKGLTEEEVSDRPSPEARTT